MKSVIVRVIQNVHNASSTFDSNSYSDTTLETSDCETTNGRVFVWKKTFLLH